MRVIEKPPICIALRRFLRVAQRSAGSYFPQIATALLRYRSSVIASIASPLAPYDNLSRLINLSKKPNKKKNSYVCLLTCLVAHEEQSEPLPEVAERKLLDRNEFEIILERIVAWYLYTHTHSLTQLFLSNFVMHTVCCSSSPFPPLDDRGTGIIRTSSRPSRARSRRCSAAWHRSASCTTRVSSRTSSARCSRPAASACARTKSPTIPPWYAFTRSHTTRTVTSRG